MDGTDSVFAPTDDLSELARSGPQRKKRRSKRNANYQSIGGSELKRSRANHNKKSQVESSPPNMEYLDTEDFMPCKEKLTPSTDTYMAGSNEDFEDSNEKFKNGIAIYSTHTL